MNSRIDKIISEFKNQLEVLSKIKDELNILDVDDVEKSMKKLKSVIRDNTKHNLGVFEVIV